MPPEATAVAGKLRSMSMGTLKDAYVCCETIYSAIYALPVGELRKEVIICLRLVYRHIGGAHQWLTDVGEDQRCDGDLGH